MRRFMPAVVLSLFCVLAPGTPYDAEAAQYGYGPWGGNQDPCQASFGGNSGRGGVSFLGSDYDAAAIVTQIQAPYQHYIGVQVRGRSFVWNDWGYGSWVSTSGWSTHDCGTVSCQYAQCRIRVWH